MILIFEGPDCGGKDTLIEEWKAENGEPEVYFHNGPYATVHEAFEAFHKQIDELEKLPFGKIGILNRGFISACIYGPMLGGPNFIPTPMMVEEVQKRLMALGALTIFCIPPLSICQTKWQERIEDELVKDVEQYQRIHSMYLEIFNGTRMNAHLYDYSGNLNAHLYDYSGNLNAERIPPSLVLMKGGKK